MIENTLTSDSPVEDVRDWLREVRAVVADLEDPLDRAAIREQAVEALKPVEAVSAPTKMVDAALDGGDRRGTVDDAAAADNEEEIPEEKKKRAVERLESPDLLDRAVETMRDHGLVAEGTNARVVYLSAVGGALGAPIHLVVHGDSSAGKNTVVGRPLALLPRRYVLAVSGLSQHALEYRGGRIEGVLVVDEVEGQGQAEYGLRIAMSEGRLTRLTVNKSEDGRNRAEELEVEVAASVITTTTEPAIHPENQTRVFDLFVDESEDVTEKVLIRRAREAAGTAEVATGEELEAWRTAVELLEPLDVVVPWAEKLADGFPTGGVRARRDFPRVLALVEACALLHQRRRPRDAQGRLVATREDWRIVRPLVQEVLGDSMTGINETARKLAALHDELAESQPGEWVRRPDLEAEANDRDIASSNTVHKWAKRLTELGVWEGRREAGKAWEHRRMRDVTEEPIPLPRPEELPQQKAAAPPSGDGNRSSRSNGAFEEGPNPPNTGGGSRSSRRDRGSERGPNPSTGAAASPMGGRHSGGRSANGVSEEGRGDPRGEAWEGWEANVSPSETGAEPPSHGGSEGMGTRSSSPEDRQRRCACGFPIPDHENRCDSCRERVTETYMALPDPDRLESVGRDHPFTARRTS